MKDKTENPFVKGYRTGERALTPNQVEKLLERVTDLHDLGLIQLGVSTGIRREDIVGIKTKDVDAENSSVTFYERKKSRTRTVFVSGNVMNTLKMIQRINGTNPYLFPTRKSGKSKHLSGRAAYNILNKYLEAAGLPRRPFHSLRGTCYKMCQRKGWTPEQAAEHIGDTLTVAQRHYAVPSVEELKEAATSKPII
jgi:integrase